ncbi:hypothetical protein AVEN_228078-1 [Araneus ventricosus]|uniref:Uncharacterized protein n=1 Tax=Araneus ventricosus TaxID=182803 RepID=A0A4Y2F9N4_ARAVE|nr:hypothetical protein AVEN_228078-1 [Araneus ventricosus]
MMKTTPGIPSLSFCIAPTEGSLDTTHDLACYRPTADHQWKRVSSLEPSGHEVEALPLDHRDLMHTGDTQMASKFSEGSDGSSSDHDSELKIYLKVAL